MGGTVAKCGQSSDGEASVTQCHVALHKCNVSPGQQVNNCCPPENKMTALNLQVYKCFLKLI